MNPDPQSELDDLWRRSNLSAAQMLVWVSQKRHPAIPLHNATPAVWIIAAEIDRNHLERAFQAVLDGSDALRTVIEEKDGVPGQRVLPHVPFSLELLDFAQASAPMRELQSWALKRSQRVFDFGQPMFDSALVRLPDGQFAWYFNHHRIIADGWSVLLIFRRTAELYESLVKGRQTVSADLPKFADFVAYETRLRETPDYQNASRYWRQKLQDPPPPIAFAGTGPVSLATRRFRLSRDLGPMRSQRLRAIAEGPAFADSFPHLALFAVFAGVFLTSLFHISGHRRLALGTPVSNRPSQRFQRTLGLFTHQAVLFVELSGNETLIALARKARDEMMKVLRRQHYVPAMLPPQELCDALINYCHTTTGTFLGSAVRTEILDLGYQDDSQEKLSMQIRDFDATGSFVVDFRFRRDVFNEEEGAQVVDQVLGILDSFLEDEQRPVGQLSRSRAGPYPLSQAMVPSETKEQSPVAERTGNFPRTSTEDLLTQVWAKSLGLEQVGLYDNFFDLGGTSVQAVRLFSGIEEVFGVNLPLSTLLQAPTIADLSRLLGSDGDSSQWPSLVEIQRGAGGTPLFCAHGLGGDILGFRNLARHLDPRRPVFGLRARGLDGRQPPMDRIEDMAAAYIREIRGVQPEGPYSVIGFSFGGFVAFEIARQLAAQGHSIRLLGVLDSRKALTKRLFLLNLLLLPVAQKMEFFRAALGARAHGGALSRGRLPAWTAKAGRLGLRPRRIGVVRKGCVKAIRRYVPLPFEGRMTLFRTSALLVPSVLMRLRYPWNEFCRGGVEIQELTCDHWSILQEPHVQLLAEMLEKYLAESDAPSGEPSKRVGRLD